jgi:conjugative transfer signal peptidase TraF
MVLAFGALASAAGARINVSGSIPLGLYWTTRAPVARNAYVVFCPPRSEIFDEAMRRGYIGPGFCEGGYGYMMKRVVAMQGDTVRIDADGVRVNGLLVACSVPKAQDEAGQVLPQLRRALQLGSRDVLLMSDKSPEAFDARYFGPLDAQQIQAVIEPVWTWGGRDASVHC